MALPFEIAAAYDPVTRSQGDISYADFWVIVPYGGTLGAGYANSWQAGDNPDIWFEVVPGTLLRASVSGIVSVRRNPVTTTPSGAPFDPKDWELSIRIGDGVYSVGYDHMVDMLVEDGDFVQAGQRLGHASPASIRHGSPEGEKPVGEFEWGMRRAWPTRADSLCPFDFLSQAHQAKLLSVLENMGDLGFTTGDRLCLVSGMVG